MTPPPNPLTADEAKRHDRITAAHAAGKSISKDDAAFLVTIVAKMRGALPPVSITYPTDLVDGLGLDDFDLCVSRSVREPLGQMTIDGIAIKLPTPIALVTREERRALEAWREAKLAALWAGEEQALLSPVNPTTRTALDAKRDRWVADRTSFVFVEGEARFDLRALAKVVGMTIEDGRNVTCGDFVGRCGPRLLVAWLQTEEARAANWNADGLRPRIHDASVPGTPLAMLMHERAALIAQRTGSTYSTTLAWWTRKIAEHNKRRDGRPGFEMTNEDEEVSP